MALADGIQIVGRYEAERTINAIVTRLDHWQAAAPAIWSLLEDEYEQRFDDWFPHMYETGATKDAWTDSGAFGALRRAHGGGIEFGSTIYYNRFHSGELLESDSLTEDKLAELLASFVVAPDADEVQPSWMRPRDSRTGRFMKVR